MSLTVENPTGVPANESFLHLFLRFLRFGLMAWGGPVAQIAMIRQELVEEDRWITKEQFNRVLAVYQILPGPEAHEMCVYFGMLARGRLGGLLAGLGFHELRIRGSHHIFQHPSIPQQVNLQPTQCQTKAYEIREVVRLILQYNLGLEAEP